MEPTVRRGVPDLALGPVVGAAALLLALSIPVARAGPGTCPLLGPPVTSGASLNIVRFAVADFNEDGISDLVTTFAGSVFSVHFGLGTAGVANGHFGPATTYATPSTKDFAVADFNDDGILDLAATIPLSVSVRLGQGSGGVGNGTFGVATPYGVASQFPVIARDFDEDGVTDLAYGNGNGPYALTVLRGNGTNGVGNGTFAVAVGYTVTALPSVLVTGDFNEDGRTDVAMLAGGNVITTLLGTGTGAKGNGGFSAATNYVVNSIGSGLVTGDFNEDGRTDLAFTESGGDVAVMFGNGIGSVGDGTFATPPARSFVGFLPHGLGVADFTGDGIADLVVALDSDSVAVMAGGGVGGVGNGTFALASRFKAAPTPFSLQIGDFTADGLPDVLVANYDTASVQVFPGACTPTAPVGVAVGVPNGGEAWVVGSEHAISWTRGDGVIAVDVEVSRDAGANWERIASNVTESSFAWTVTAPPTGLARVRVRDSAVGSRKDVSDTTFVIDLNVAAVEDRAPGLVLGQPSPNPFSRSVRVTLSLARPVEGASVVVCGVDGRLVARLHEGAMGAGTRTLEWDGTLADGRRAAPGVYFVRAMVPGEGETTQRAVLLE